MKNLHFLFLVMITTHFGFASGQQANVSIYNPQADARADINTAVTQAASEHKQVLIQVGGNWCPWCVKMNTLFHSNYSIDSLLKAEYVFIHVNYSKENKNLKVLQGLDFPQRFGFPVLVVLDGTGKRIHTQDTSLLENGEGYDTDKIISFLKGWKVAALDPKNY